MSNTHNKPDAPDGFLSRWSRRKAQARGGTLAPEAPAAPALGQAPLPVQSPTGPTGPTGPAGPAGPAGASGASVPPRAWAFLRDQRDRKPSGA
ncbi:MAG: hypothetical protein ACKOD9_01515, partial [Rubrivivax sp.]